MEVFKLQEQIESLTSREREVLILVLNGKVSKQIARQLGIRPKTVDAYRSRVLKKMQAKSMAEVVKQVVDSRVTLS